MEKRHKKNITYRHSRGDLQQMQSLPLKMKIQMTERRVFDWYDHWQGDVCLSFSGGKDSTVLKHIIDSMGLGIPSVFANTGLEFPEIQKFAMSQPNVTTVRPKMMFPEVIKNYGYPIISKEVSKCIYYAKKNGAGSVAWEKMHGELVWNGKLSRYNFPKWGFLCEAPFSISSHCCNVMKKAPLHAYQRQTKRKPILATMAEESQLREAAWMVTGCNAYDSKEPISKPMSFWTEQDVLHYIKENHLPICSVYGDIRVKCQEDGEEDQVTFADYFNQYDGEVLETSGMRRTGCMFCMYGCHLEKEPNRFQKMKKTHPRQYEYCIGGGEFVDGKWQPNKQGLGLGYVLDYIGVKYE